MHHKTVPRVPKTCSRVERVEDKPGGGVVVVDIVFCSQAV